MRVQAQTAARLVAGQLSETVGPGPDVDVVEHHLSVIRDKTGSLVSAACQLGALLAGAEETVVATLSELGEELGVAFQLADDLLDLEGNRRVSGKQPGTDLREGTVTLPLLRVRQHASPGDDRLVDLIGRPLSTSEVAEALDLLRGHPGMAVANEEVVARVRRAQACVERLPGGPARRLLEVACEAASHRER
jgi:heptaprenyl diphosphate synthase